jgi:hypothetical protein
VNRALSLLLVGLGLAVVGRTVAAGVGGGAGLLLGSLIALVGAARLYLGSR